MRALKIIEQFRKITESKKKVLVVDDEQDLLEIICMYVEEAGFDHDSASTVQEAERLIKSGKYALLLTDVNLKGKKGSELFPSAREAGMKIILVSGDSDNKQKYITDIDGFIDKPFDERVFAKTLKAVMSEREAAVMGVEEATGNLSKKEIQEQIDQLLQFIEKEKSKSDKEFALKNWLETKDFVTGDVDNLGDQYKKFSDKDKSLPDWDEAVHFAFNESATEEKE